MLTGVQNISDRMQEWSQHCDKKQQNTRWKENTYEFDN